MSDHGSSIEYVQPHCGICGDPVGERVAMTRGKTVTATCPRHTPPITPLTPRQLARFLGYDPKPEYPCRVRITGEGNDQEREVEVVYRGLRLVRLDTRQHGDLEAWWPHRIDLPDAGEGMPTTLTSEDFLPIVDVPSVVETIRLIDVAAEWYAEDAPVGPPIRVYVPDDPDASWERALHRRIIEAQSVAGNAGVLLLPESLRT